MDRILTIHITGAGPAFEVIASSPSLNAPERGTFDVNRLHEALVPGYRASGTPRGLGDPDAESLVLANLDPRALGTAIYAELFAGDVGRAFDTLARDAKSGVRIRLLIDVAQGGQAEHATRLASVPWELMCPRPNVVPLAMGTRTRLVRTIPHNEREPIERLAPPLRVLLIASNPDGTPELNLGNEAEVIRRCFGDASSRGVKVRQVKEPTVMQVMQELDDAAKKNQRYHVVHFMGHGEFDSKTGNGAILLQQPGSRKKHRVESDAFNQMLSPAPPSLVYLNACKTAVTDAGAVLNPFGGMAPSLLENGVPAVVAMQYPISDIAAVRFAELFYYYIARGERVDDAMWWARSALKASHDGDDVSDTLDTEWATPVLYLRPSSGEVFALDDAASVPDAVVGPNVAPNVAPTVATADAAPSASRAADAPFTIFLADMSGVTGASRRSLKMQLEKLGMFVQPAVLNEDDAKSGERAVHEARVRELAAQADLCVHVLGAEPGDLLDDGVASATQPDSYPVHQLTLCSEMMRPQLVLLDVAAVRTDPVFDAFVRGLDRVQREDGEFEIIQERVTKLGELIRARRDRIVEARRRAEAAARAATERPKAYIDVHERDLDEAEKLKAHLAAKGFQAIPLTTLDGEDADPRRYERAIQSAAMLILFYGHVGHDWFKNRWTMANQIKTLQELSTRIGVYVGPPEQKADAKKPVREALSGYLWADGTNGFEPESVDHLIGGQP